MRRTPNIIPDQNAHCLTFDEVTNNDFVGVDDYVWVELRHGKQNFEFIEDEVFNLRVGFVNAFGIDLCAPTGALHYSFSDYNLNWRIWNVCPVWENTELWRDERK